MRHDDDPRHEHGDFAKGEEHEHQTPEEELESDFARGVAETDPDKHGRFSTGQEELPDSPDKEVERRFSEGIERSPTSD